MSVIDIRDLHYSVQEHFWVKKKPILRGVTLSVEAGEIFGFLGPNGAGKTTTLKSLLGLLVPERGEARIFGGLATDPKVRQRVGFMPERAYYPEHLSARELLIGHGLLAGLSKREADKRSESILEDVGLLHAKNERLRGFSKGMLQRVGLGQALMGDPELVVLDEPMSDLDPIGRYDVRAIMLRLREQKKTVFFSTHILPDIEALSDRVAMLVKGQVKRVATVHELLQDTAARIEVVASGVNDTILHRHTNSPRNDGVVFAVPNTERANLLIDELRGAGANVLAVHAVRKTLEDVFVEEAQMRPEEVR